LSIEWRDTSQFPQQDGGKQGSRKELHPEAATNATGNVNSATPMPKRRSSHEVTSSCTTRVRILRKR
jgi:hypothetical protein